MNTHSGDRYLNPRRRERKDFRLRRPEPDRAHRRARSGSGGKELPRDIRENEEAVAETIENNVRKLIINELPVDPAYYDKMSRLLDALIEQRRKGGVTYRQYLEKIAELTRQARKPGGDAAYPADIRTGAQRTLFGNLNEHAALGVDAAIQMARKDGWREHPVKTREVRRAIKMVLESTALARPRHQHEY